MPKVTFCRVNVPMICLMLVNSIPAWAGFSVEISVDGGLPILFSDNGALDLNPAVGDIEIDFTVNDVGNNWTASGTVLATGGNGGPPVSTIITDTLIEKLQPGLFNGHIEVFHNYAASGLGSHSASLDGQFENTLGSVISYTDLLFTVQVNSQFVGSSYEGPADGVPEPVPFDAFLGPLELPTTTRHELSLFFYLDAPGDAIRLFNSAELRTIVPEPGTACLALMVLGSLAASRRRSERR